MSTDLERGLKEAKEKIEQGNYGKAEEIYLDLCGKYNDNRSLYGLLEALILQKKDQSDERFKKYYDKLLTLGNTAVNNSSKMTTDSASSSFNSNLVTTSQLVITPYKENKRNYINFGRYPQTVVSDATLINELKKISQTNKFGYIEYNGNEYKKATANPYRNDYTFRNGGPIIKNDIYYFKVEPIKWRILQNEKGSYKLLSENILDCLIFSNKEKTSNIDHSTAYPNNYEYSNARAWLNSYDGSSYEVSDYKGNGFYDIAFTDEEKEIIDTVLVDNSILSVSSMNNRYVCNNTSDKIYLLSYRDIFDKTYSLKKDKGAYLSDYSKNMHCIAYDSGNGNWGLRSPNSGRSDNVYYILGTFLSDGYVTDSCTGVRPALQITIK